MQSRICVVGALVVGILSAVAQGTVLTFDFGGGNGESVPSIYGDHVANLGYPQNPAYSYGAAGGPTPNVGVVYGPLLRLAGAPNPFDPSRVFGDLQNVLYRDRFPDPETGILRITLVGDPGYEVSLLSFDIAAVFNSITGGAEDLPLRSIMVLNHEGDALYSLLYDPAVTDHDSLLSTYAPGTQPLRHKHFAWPAGLTSRTITIRLDLGQLITIGGTKVDRVGIDNITFGQGVVLPSPGSMALIAAAGLFVARRKRPLPRSSGGDARA